MSGTGKSTVTRRLAEHGYKAVDADDDGLTETLPDGTQRWREDAIEHLLGCGRQADPVLGGM
jgi:adenylate kinase family enzyme